MDESEKYKQRLEAIAEKRRLQEEQDRAKREKEDERLRLQQLKRKSLRDQWLMEGPLLSPTSPDSHSPRSPLWTFQAQENNQHTEKLQSGSQQLAEEKEELKDQMEGSQTQKIVKRSETAEEITQDAAVQNGEDKAAGSDTSEDQMKTNQSLSSFEDNESTTVLTNGSGGLNSNTNHSASEASAQSTTNGPICTTEDAVGMMLEPGISLSDSEAEPGQVPSVSINEEEEEGTVVMRAERVIITDEGDDVSENLAPQEGEQETIESEEIPLPKPEESKQEDTVGGLLKAEEAPEMFTQPEKSESIEPTTEAHPVNADGDVEGEIKTNGNGDGGIKADGLDKQSEDPTSLQLQSLASALEDATVASLPVYSKTQPSTLSPEAEGEAAVSPQGAEAAVKVQDPATTPDHFQEVSLTDPQENQRTEGDVEEQEPLLSQSKAHNTQEAPVATNSPASTETHSPAGALQGEGTEAPKRKTCQCCSIM